MIFERIKKALITMIVFVIGLAIYHGWINPETKPPIKINKMIDKLESLYTEKAEMEKSVTNWEIYLGKIKDQQELDILEKQFSAMQVQLHCIKQRIELETNKRNLNP